MKRIGQILFVGLLAVVILAGCGDKSEQTGTQEGTNEATSEKLQVVTTFSVLYDIVKNVGGDRIELHSMVPLGTDPHEYTPLPVDIQKAIDTDVMFWNGLNMEMGDGWFENLVEVAGKSLEDGPVYELSKCVAPMYLKSEDGRDEEINPHAFLDVTVGTIYTENARDVLMEVDPEHASIYEKNAEDYMAKLESLHQEYQNKISAIPLRKEEYW